MNLPKFLKDFKEAIQSVPDRVALRILIWLEKEPSQERVVTSPSCWEIRGPYLRYRARVIGHRKHATEKTIA